MTFNGLFKVNIESGDCEYIDSFPNEKMDIQRIHAKSEYVNNRVYFIPASGSFISVFD